MKVVLPVWIKLGAKFRWCGALWHVRAIVDGAPVCRRRDKRGWHYERLEPVVIIKPTDVKRVR